MVVPFRDRRDAGQRLACALKPLKSSKLCVLGIPTGGVAVAYEIADLLDAPLDVFVTRSLPALARHTPPLGVLGSGGARVLNRDLIYGSHVPPRMIDELTRVARAALLSDESVYRQEGAPWVDVRHRSVILVDDGTSGLDQLRQCILLLRELEAERVVAAIPILARGQASALAHLTDDVVTVATPEVHEPLRWYDDFAATTSGEVRALLALAHAQREFTAA